MAVISELIEIAEFESLDRKAKQAGLIIAISGELYTRSFGKNSAVYIERRNNRLEAWKETLLTSTNRQTNCKVIVESKDFDYVLLKVNKFFDYFNRRRSQRKIY